MAGKSTRVAVRIFTGEERRMGGEGGRNHSHVLGKENGFARQPVKIGRADPGIAIAANVVGSGGIQRNKYDMPGGRRDHAALTRTQH